MSLVELRRYFSSGLAESTRMALESHGIHAVVFDFEARNADNTGMTRLMVLDDDYDAAVEILAGAGDN